MTRALARIVEYARGRRMALPTHTTYEIVESPRPVRVPGAAPHALGLLAWQGGRIPMIDVDCLVHGTSAPASAEAMAHALVVAWQDAPGKPLQYGAIALAGLPVTVEVDDAKACRLPDGGNGWARLAHACFRNEGDAVPVADTARLFGAFDSAV